jgi:3',5'-cyclic AMP phosphodiesterase CpdA
VTTLVQLSDPHFGRDVDLGQIAALETLVPALRPTAIVLAGDLSQRARHGELQRALVFVDRLRQVAPTLVIPGNHDVQWWESPFEVLGVRRKYAKYRHYFGEDLSPTLALPGVVLASALTSHGVTWKSLTGRFWRDTAVKGHLPLDELERAAATLARAPAGTLRVLVVHHNVLRGEISRRMGLARWRTAQRRIADCGADLVLCGHDHQEGAAWLGRVVVATSGTHTPRTRGGRPASFNLVTAAAGEIAVTHYRWDRGGRRFSAADPLVFPVRARAVAATATRGAPLTEVATTRENR